MTMTSGMTRVAGPGSTPMRWPDPEIRQTNAPEGYPVHPGFEWRLPVVYDKVKNRHLVGQPGMNHVRMMQNFQDYGQDPWTQIERFTPGFVDLEGHVGEAGLHWFNNSNKIPDENLHNYIEEQHGIRNTGQVPHFQAQEEDEWT